MVAQSNGTELVWGAGILVLGVVLTIVTLAIPLSVGTRRIDDFGVLMMVYEVAMLFVGASTYLENTSMVQGTLLSAVSMFVVGTLMVANGTIMRHSRTMSSYPP
jgi:uncharacterized membrane protein YhaH (DUF805 family)